MSSPTFKFSLSILTLILAACAEPPETAGQDHAHHMHDDATVPADSEIGTVDFRVACDEAVRADFDRALALKHHMMYVQARREFSAIKERAPDCGMAHWGVAATLFQPLWGTRPDDAELERGARNSERAAELVSDPREQALVAAVNAFFAEPNAAFWDRLHGWIDGMAEAHRDFPDDLDIAALQGLALLTLAQQADDRHALHDEAEAILRRAWEQEPAHPGAIHYSIHATDADGRERNALDMVDSYAAIAPHTAHALHMPSHIHVRLGYWPEVIDWNARSADAALRDPVNGSVSHHYIHAIDYMVYAHLQRGEDEQADSLFEQVVARDPHQASFISAYHFAAMPARLAVERRDWASAANLSPRTPEYLPWDQSHWPESMSWYAIGLGAVNTGDLERATEAEARLQALAKQARAADESRMANYIEADRKVLSGWLANAKGEPDEAIKLMRRAAELEADVEKHPVEPGSLQPANEALGDLLMQLEKPEQALNAYRASQGIWPGRYRTLLGAARAARAIGDDDSAGEYYAELLAITGDSTRPGIKEAKSFLE